MKRKIQAKAERQKIRKGKEEKAQERKIRVSKRMRKIRDMKEKRETKIVTHQ